jgi:hypothetical protein
MDIKTQGYAFQFSDYYQQWKPQSYVTDWVQANFPIGFDIAGNRFTQFGLNYINDDPELVLNADWLELTQGKLAWCKPYYPALGDWMEKAAMEASRGTKLIMMVPTPNGESHYRDNVFKLASKIIFINGRVPFIAATDFKVKNRDSNKPDKEIKKGDKASGNTRGSCFIIYDRKYNGVIDIDDIDRDEMIRFSREMKRFQHTQQTQLELSA